jgi:hypothetical protein
MIAPSVLRKFLACEIDRTCRHSSVVERALRKRTVEGSIPSSGFCAGSVVFFNLDSFVRKIRFDIQRRFNQSGPYRLAVRTSRCGRDNPGSNPGTVIFPKLYR